MKTATKERPILWQPTPKQREFLAGPAREVLYAGSVGAGKTDAIIMSAVSQTGNKNHRALILRKTFPQLRDVVARAHELFLPLGATFNKQENVFVFSSGARVELGFLDAPEDMYRYMGRAFSCLCWEELTAWGADSTDNEGQPVSGAYIYMMSRLRSTDPTLRLEIRASCTPGGIGASWTKHRWQIPDSGESSEVIDKATGYRRVFIRATIADNPHLANTAYARSLESLPPAQHRALVEGRWDSYEGQVFSEWNYNKHTCQPFPIPAEWQTWRGADDGFAAPFACEWICRDPVMDRIYVIAELYQRGLTPEVAAREVLRIDRSIQVQCDGEVIDNDAPIDGVIDSASFADVGLGDASGRGGRAEIMNRLNCRWSPSPKGSGSRVAGVSAIHQRLALKADGFGGLVIFRNCRNLIRTLPAMTYSRTNPEDIDPSCEEHAVKGLMYGLTRSRISCGTQRVRWAR
jgi:Terminase large subunit, T4likevirus-type, N-terminal